MLSVPKPMAKPFRTAGDRQGAVKEKRNHSEQKPHENWLWFYIVCLCPGHFHKELHYWEHHVCIHSAHGRHHCPCPAKLGPPHGPAHQPRAPFQLLCGHEFLSELSRRYLSSHQPQLCPCLATEPVGPASVEAPTTSELEPPRHHVTPRAGRNLATNPLLPQHWSLGWEPESCIATATISSLCVKRQKPALPATSLISASCSQAWYMVFVLHLSRILPRQFYIFIFRGGVAGWENQPWRP